MVALFFVLATLRIALPYLYCALAGLWSERAGVVHIGLEGLLLSSAFAATIGAAHGGLWLGAAAAIGTSLVLSTVFALLVVYRRADPILVGVALNLFADGATRFALRAIYDSSSNSPRIDRWPSGGVVEIVHPLLLVGLGLVGVTAWALSRTAFGLRVRAAGAAPDALRAAAVSVPRVRFAALLIAGPIAALGGLFLAWNSHQFVAGMSNGRGFLALAALLIGRRQPVAVLMAALGLGASQALDVLFPGNQTGIPDWLMQALPYIATLIVLALRRGPAKDMVR